MSDSASLSTAGTTSDDAAALPNLDASSLSENLQPSSSGAASWSEQLPDDNLQESPCNEAASSTTVATSMDSSIFPQSTSETTFLSDLGVSVSPEISSTSSFVVVSSELSVPCADSLADASSHLMASNSTTNISGNQASSIQESSEVLMIGSSEMSMPSETITVSGSPCLGVVDESARMDIPAENPSSSLPENVGHMLIDSSGLEIAQTNLTDMCISMNNSGDSSEMIESTSLTAANMLLSEDAAIKDVIMMPHIHSSDSAMANSMSEAMSNISSAIDSHSDSGMHHLSDDPHNMETMPPLLSSRAANSAEVPAVSSTQDLRSPSSTSGTDVPVNMLTESAVFSSSNLHPESVTDTQNISVSSSDLTDSVLDDITLTHQKMSSRLEDAVSSTQTNTIPVGVTLSQIDEVLSNQVPESCVMQLPIEPPHTSVSDLGMLSQSPPSSDPAVSDMTAFDNIGLNTPNLSSVTSSDLPSTQTEALDSTSASAEDLVNAVDSLVASGHGVLPSADITTSDLSPMPNSDEDLQGVGCHLLHSGENSSHQEALQSMGEAMQRLSDQPTNVTSSVGSSSLPQPSPRNGDDERTVTATPETMSQDLLSASQLTPADSGILMTDAASDVSPNSLVHSSENLISRSRSSLNELDSSMTTGIINSSDMASELRQLTSSEASEVTGSDDAGLPALPKISLPLDLSDDTGSPPASEVSNATLSSISTAAETTSANAGTSLPSFASASLPSILAGLATASLTSLSAALPTSSLATDSLNLSTSVPATTSASSSPPQSSLPFLSTIHSSLGTNVPSILLPSLLPSSLSPALPIIKPDPEENPASSRSINPSNLYTIPSLFSILKQDAAITTISPTGPLPPFTVVSGLAPMAKPDLPDSVTKSLLMAAASSLSSKQVLPTIKKEPLSPVPPTGCSKSAQPPETSILAADAMLPNLMGSQLPPLTSVSLSAACSPGLSLSSPTLSPVATTVPCPPATMTPTSQGDGSSDGASASSSRSPAGISAGSKDSPSADNKKICCILCRNGTPCSIHATQTLSGTSQPSLAPGPLASGDPAKPYRCHLCGKHLASRNVYHLHMRSHSGEKPFTCSQCGHHFSQKTSLTRHMRSHTGERPFPCEVCGKRFADKERIKIHMRTHTGEKPFACEICGKCFSQKSTVKRHMSVHTGEKPFKCETCGKGFANRGNLNAHSKTHTNNT